MKKIMFATAALLVLSIGVAMGVKKTNLNQNNWMANIEALCGSEDASCFSGGPGADECSIDASAGPVGAACSVHCSSGYACCSYNGCHCVR